MKILVIDDDSVDREIVIKALKSLDAEFVQAQDGRTALAEVIKSADLALILMDYNLPDYDGLSLLADLKKLTAAPIIVVTGIGDSDLVKATHDAGVLDYIPKDRISAEFLTRTILNDLLIHRTMLEKQHMITTMTRRRTEEHEVLNSIIDLARKKIAEFDKPD